MKNPFKEFLGGLTTGYIDPPSKELVEELSSMDSFFEKCSIGKCICGKGRVGTHSPDCIYQKRFKIIKE